MKIVITAPMQGITKSPYSHRSAKAFIYAEVFREGYPDAQVDIDIGRKLELTDYDLVVVYHGDYAGSLNLFGGIEGFNPHSIASLSRCKPEAVISLEMKMPNYVSQLLDRAKGDENHPNLKGIDFENWKALLKGPEPTPWTPFCKRNLVLGDSHAISLYRPGWSVWQIPFRTLFGSMKDNRKNMVDLVKEYRVASCDSLDNVELYFGNIDIRHHLCRDTESNDERMLKTLKLGQAYVKAALEISEAEECDVTFIAALPIENESRKLPKSGYYKGAAFHGSWEERNAVKDAFNQLLENAAKNHPRIKFSNPWEHYINTSGELSFEYMEKPRSVHLARKAYPYWTGEPEVTDLSSFME